MATESSPRRVTIHDVAAEAGVSRQTVTRAVNGMGDISPATRDRVLEISERLGYRPSRFARNLVTRQKVHALGLLTPSLTNPYFTEIADDMLAAAADRGWQLIIAATRHGQVKEAMALLRGQVDVIVGHFTADLGPLSQWSGGVPLITLDAEDSVEGIHSVAVDIRGGLAAAVAELRGRGSRHIAMIDSAYSVRSVHRYVPTPRRGFFEEAMGDAAIVVTGEETISGGAAAFLELVQSHPEVDAVIVFNDLMALGAVQAARSLQLDVPDRMRILGIDGIALGEAVDPRLSSLSLNHAAIAAGALDIVERLADAGFAKVEPIHLEVPPVFVWRESA